MTSAYKKKLEEVRRQEELDRRQAELEGERARCSAVRLGRPLAAFICCCSTSLAHAHAPPSAQPRTT